MMYIDTVTITGADDNVDRNALYDLSDKYPFVEWGILLHPDKRGTPRYPTDEWRDKFDRYAPDFVSRSVHICGKAATAFCNGDLSIVRDSAYNRPQYERLQVNIHEGITSGVADVADLLIRSNAVIPTIIQMNRITHSIISTLIKRSEGRFVQILFDASRGTGKPIHVPVHVNDVRENYEFHDRKFFTSMNGFLKIMQCGFAGGITPVNVEDIIKRLMAISNSHYCAGVYPPYPRLTITPPPTWIDLESGVRTNNEFDLEKVELVLKNAKQAMGGNYGE